MKANIKLIILVLTVFLFNACDQNYIDGISRVDPGEDESAPQVTINFPPEGYEIQTNDAIASVDIDFEVRDDIEIGSISVNIDGTEIANYTQFMDYRIAMKTYTYDNVTTGSHVLSVTANDLDGKSTTVSVNFAKSPPYVPEYEGEVFYMSFNNEFREMNSLNLATTVGSPAFAEGIQGGTAYSGAADSYLSFPISGFSNSNELSAAFWLKMDASATRAGILSVGVAGNDGSDRTKGFRIFREGDATTQRFKLNAGSGSAETWFDGGANADVTVDGSWVHVAFTLSGTEGVIYINGEEVSQNTFEGIDWTGCETLSIMSGDPGFAVWDHLSEPGMMDELRIFNTALTQDEIHTIMLKEQASFYMDFNGDYKEAISSADATVVGNPSLDYGGGVEGDAYQGATDSYLSFSTADVDIQGEEFSACFWMNINATPDRAGILVMGPEDNVNPDAQNDRTSGFRFFRENAGGMQRFKLNAGNGTEDSWFDGGAAADVDPTTGDWVHMAFAISGTQARVYIGGVEVSQGDFSGIDWTGCNLLSIMSGAPRFNGWDHLSDESLMDELYLFKKALSAEEVVLMMQDGL